MVPTFSWSISEWKSKMRIAVCSDIHLEFGPISLQNTDNADVLILGGDICVAKDILNKDDAGIFDRFEIGRAHV